MTQDNDFVEMTVLRGIGLSHAHCKTVIQFYSEHGARRAIGQPPDHLPLMAGTAMGAAIGVLPSAVLSAIRAHVEQLPNPVPAHHERFRAGWTSCKQAVLDMLLRHEPTQGEALEKIRQLRAERTEQEPKC